MRKEETRSEAAPTPPEGPSVGRWLVGGLLVVSGAISGAFGAVAWLEALRIPSLFLALVGIVLLGIVPVILGLGLVWTGLGVIEDDPPRAALQVSDDVLLQATKLGATRDEVALRIGPCDMSHAERRLDELVVREQLELDLTEDGALIYRPHVDDTTPPA